jgi:hypothetical protein
MHRTAARMTIYFVSVLATSFFVLSRKRTYYESTKLEYYLLFIIYIVLCIFIWSLKGHTPGRKWKTHNGQTKHSARPRPIDR